MSNFFEIFDLYLLRDGGWSNVKNFLYKKPWTNILA